MTPFCWTIIAFRLIYPCYISEKGDGHGGAGIPNDPLTIVTLVPDLSMAATYEQADGRAIK